MVANFATLSHLLLYERQLEEILRDTTVVSNGFPCKSEAALQHCVLLLCAEVSTESISTAAAAESSAAAQLLVNAMNPSMSVASNTGAARQITPSTPIVLSAEALTSLLMMNVSQQQQQQPATASVDLNAHQLLQYMAEQAVQAVTLSMDTVNVPTVTELSASGTTLEPMSNDLEVGAQEMVLEEGTGSQKQHPLHLN